MHPHRRLITSILLAGLCAIALALTARAQDSAWSTIEESWFVVEIDGGRAGFAVESIADDGQRYRTEWEQMLTVRRGETTTTLRLRSASIETHRGDPVRIESHMLLSETPERRTWTFQPDGTVEERTERGATSTARVVPQPKGTWFMPRAAARFEDARREAGARSITLRTIDVSGGLRAMNVEMDHVGEETATLEGRRIPVTVWDVSAVVEDGDGAAFAQKRRVMISEDGRVMHVREQAGSLTLTMRRVSKHEAMRPLDAVPELLISAFIRPSRRIAAPHRTTSATYRLVFNGQEQVHFPSSSVQKALRDEEHDAAWVISVNLNDPADAPQDDLDHEPYLLGSPLCDSEDELIVAMAGQTLQRAGDVRSRRAEALREAVYRHLHNKDLGTAFASASEAIRSRSGDCTEHAVLLCALLRADGIPARIATGLVYVESFGGQRNVFGWHMWTQALIDGKWVDLDATLRHPFSAVHILTGTSSLADGALSDEITRLAVLMGQLSVEVIETGYTAPARIDEPRRD